MKNRQTKRTKKLKTRAEIFVSSLILVVITLAFVFSVDASDRQKFRDFIWSKEEFQSEIEIPKLFDFTGSVSYTVFEDSRIPFTFKYPTGWHVKVYLSKDRENYFDRILLASSSGDFRIFINSFVSFNPHYSRAQEYISENNFTLNPFEEQLIRFDPEGFVFVDNFAESFVFAQEGGTVSTFDTEKSVYNLKPSFLILGQREFIYQKRGDGLSKRLILGDPNEQAVKVGIVNISFEVVNNIPQLVWFLNREILIEMLYSIQVK